LRRARGIFEIKILRQIKNRHKINTFANNNLILFCKKKSEKREYTSFFKFLIERKKIILIIIYHKIDWFFKKMVASYFSGIFNR